MKKLFASLTILLFVLTTASTGMADDLIHPARTVLIIHSSTPLTETGSVSLHGDFVLTSSQTGYLSASWRPGDWAFIQSGVGLAAKINEAGIFLRCIMSFGKVLPRFCLTWWPQGESFNLQARLNLKITQWLEVGVETEGQSDLSNDSNYSWGVGPTAVFRFNILVVDLVAYYGNIAGGDPDDFGFGLVGRAHLYF